MASFEKKEKKFIVIIYNFFQRSAISGLSLGMDAPYLYRSLVFGAVCGLYHLIEGFEKQEIAIKF